MTWPASGGTSVNGQRRGLILAVVALLSAGLLLADLNSPRGAAVQVGYVAAVLISLWSPWRQDTYLVAVVGTVFTGIGLVFSPAGDPAWIAWFNHLFALFLIWLTTVLGLAARRTAELAEANARLQEEV